MSIFVNENAIPAGKGLVANEDYQGEIGAYTILAENVQNDLAMFNSLIAGDFAESKAIHENATEKDLSLLTESAGVRLFDNMKNFLAKAYEKIKGLIKSFITRLQTVVTRDNAKLVEKHRSAVLSKDLSKFKFTWSVSKDNKDSVFPKAISNTGAIVDKLKDEVTKNSGVELSNISLNNLVGKVDSGDLVKQAQERNTSEAKAAMVSNAMGINASGVEYGSLTKSVMENLFDEKAEIEGMSDRLRNDIMQVLTSSKDVIKGLKEAEKKIDSQYNNELKRLNSLRSEFEKLTSGTGKVGEHNVDAGDAGKAIRGVNYVYDITKIHQEVMTKTISTTMSVIKVKTKEARAAFARAAAFRAVGEEAGAENDLVEGDKDTTVEINIEIEDPVEDKELVEAIEDDSDNIVEEQFTGGMGY